MPGQTRRKFLEALALAGGACLAPRSVLRAGDPSSSPEGARRPKDAPAEIIDTHTHFYDPTRPGGIPWPGKGDAVLYKPTLPEHFSKVARPVGVTGTVVVEASARLEDNQWLLDLAAKNPVIVGVVGNLSPGSPDFAEHLKRFAKNPLYRGFRINGGALSESVQNPEFLAGLTQVIEHGLELDVNGGPSMLPGVAALAAKLPELRIVINHLANVKNDGRAIDGDWLKGMQACAAGKNVSCKVSALAENASRKDEAGLAPKTTEYYAPLLDAVWKTWGEDRVIYGSNWPVSVRAASYADAFRVIFEYVSAKGRAASEKFFAGNAKSAYRWVERQDRAS